MAGAVHAADLPDFRTCMDVEVARFELDLSRHLEGPEPDKFAVGRMGGVEWCGTVGIVNCDRSAAPLTCQHGLVVEQDALKAAVLGDLPAPDTVTGRAGEWSDGLYPVVHALAHGASAGPDCAGSTPVMAAWCEAREANRRLGSAMLAHKLARFMDAAPTGLEAGWADIPPPLRPRARGEGVE